MRVVPIQIEYRCLGEEKLLLVDDTDFVIGRSSKLKVSIPSSNISREHIRVQLLNGKLWITDLSSTNGTYLNGKRLQAQVSQEYKGEELCIGPLGEGVYLRISQAEVSSMGVVKHTETASKLPFSAFPGVPKLDSGESKTGIEVDSGFLVKTLKEKAVVSPAAPQSIHAPAVQASAGMAEYDGYGIQVESKKKELLDLEKRRLQIERQLVDYHKAQEKAEATIRLAEEKRREHLQLEQQVLTVSRKIHESENRLTALESDEKRQKEALAQMQREVEDMQRRREEADAQYRSDERRLAQSRDQLAVREAELNRKRYELQTELEKMQTESDFIKKRILLETDTLQAEAQLRRTQVEKEIEELRTRKLGVERELENLIVRAEHVQMQLNSQIQDCQRLEAENRTALSSLTELKQIVTNTENRKRQLEAETQTLQNRINAANEESQRVLNYGRSSADETMRRATDEAKRMIEEGLRKVSDAKAKSDEELRALREELEKELQEREQKLLADIAEDRKESEEKLRQERHAWEREREELKAQAQKERDAETAAWRAEMDATRQKDLESLNQWRVEQDTRMQEKLSGDISGLIQAVSAATLTRLAPQPNRMIASEEVISQLETAFKEAILSEASSHGPFNPNRENEAKTFWLQFGKKTAIAAAVVVALITAPKIIANKFEEVKANRGTASDSSDVFSMQIKEARRRLLELNLEVREKFQPSYYENVLYNDAYLEIKQNPDVQKEWVIKLYQFFFEVLQMPDRVVVDFIPMESSVIRGLAELRKTMNAKNFKQNLEQMKALEKKKLEQEIYPLLANGGKGDAGKKNWQRLRQLEEEFYREKAAAFAKPEDRALATDPSAKTD